MTARPAKQAQTETACLTIKEVSQQLKIGVRTIYWHLRNGKNFPRPFKVGNRNRWTPEAIKQFIQERIEAGRQEVAQ